MNTAVATSAATPIRLALVITELAPGGAERCLVELATRLDRTRYSPVVYSLGSRPPAGRQLLVERLAEAAIPTHFLDLRRPWQFVSGVNRLSKLLREQRAEIVQAFLFHANVLGVRAARAAGVPRFVAGIRVADPRHWRTMTERWATAAANKIVCVSQSVADFCHERHLAAEKLVVIPNGIDVFRWREAVSANLENLGVAAGRRVFLFVGRLDEQKGLLPLVTELPRVLRHLPDFDFLLVGEGPQRAKLVERATSLGIANRVCWAGWQDDIPAIMAAADLVVLPSRWEGMPNAILEAMAAGKPVLATRAQGVLELLGEKAEQQSVTAGAWGEFAARIVTILQNRELCGHLGHWNATRAQEFSIDLMIAAYDALYGSILDRP